MNDDREVRCYALLVARLREGAEHAGKRGRRGDAALAGAARADDGCTLAAATFLGDGPVRHRIAAGRRLAQGAPGDRGQPAARGASAVEIVSPDALPLLAS